MTVFNFPDTSGKPTDGTFTWTAPNGLLYSWDGDAWRTIGGGGDGNASITITDDLTTIPAPDAGDLAWHTIEARMYIYYQDDDSQQWVDASPAGDGGGDSFWERNGTTLEPVTDGDDIQTTGDLSAAAGTFSGLLTANTTGDYSTNPGLAIEASGLHRAYRATDNADAGIQVWHSNVGSTYRPRITFWGNGSISLGGTSSNDHYNGRWNSNGTLEIGSDVPANGANITLNANGNADIYTPISARDYTWRWFSDFGGTKREMIKFESNGNAFFRGTALSNGLSFTLEPDDPANYITTTVDGEEQQVYSGPTLDVKEKLLDFVARIEALEAEVQQLKGGN